MAPEQARGKPVDARTDIWGLGVVFYEMLTRRKPFEGETTSDVMAAILTSEPKPLKSHKPEIPAEFENIIHKTLAKDKDERYQSAKYLLDELKEYKQELDFKSKLDHHNSANKQADTKTQNFEVHTGKTVNVFTNSIKDLPTAGSPFVESANKSFILRNPRNALLSLLVLIGISLFVYFLIYSASVKSPKPEAVKLFNNGTDALRDGTYFKASKMLEDAVSIDPYFSHAHAALAEAWMELDYFGRAQSEMLKVNELERQRQTFLSRFFQNEDTDYIDAINATVIRNFPQAINFYQKITARKPAEPYVYLDLGRAYEKNEEIDKAVESYRKAINLDGQYGAGYLRLGILLRRKADYDKSNEAFDRAENIYDRQSNDEGVAEVNYQRGVSFNVQEKTDAARTQFEQVINNPRTNKYQKIRAMLQISSLCSGLGKIPCAEEYASNAIALAKQERMENLASNGLINLGNAFLARAGYDKAEQNFQQALEFSRQDEGLHNEARALLSLGSLRIQQKNPDEAEDFVKQAFPFLQKGGYKKEVAQATLILGRASQMKENQDAALQAFAQVANSEDAPPADRAYAEMVSGNVLMNKEKYQEALRHYELSYSLYQSLENPYYTAYTLFYLTDALLQLGRFDDAKDKLSKVQEILKKTPSYQTQFSPRIQLLNAQMFLSQRNFTGAVKEGNQAGKSTDPSVVFEANKIVGLAQAVINPRNTEAVKNCNKALQYATGIKDLRTINTAKLSLAEAYLNTDKPSEALETALQAKDYFISAGQLDSGWRSWLIAAQASLQKGDPENAKGYAREALKTLTQIQNDWGQNPFNSYLAKPDINFYFNQAEKLAKS
jgi:tetratricopeptide (TPR) repeat protein